MKALIDEKHRGATAEQPGGHFCRDKVAPALCQEYYFPGIWELTGRVIRQCEVCQRANRVKFSKGKAPLQPIRVKPIPWHQVGIDLVGPLSSTVSTSTVYIVSTIDYFSKYVVSGCIPDKSAKTVAKWLHQNCLLRFGSPSTMVCDNGTEFKSVAQELLAITGVEQRFTSSYRGEAEQNHTDIASQSQLLKLSVTKYTDPRRVVLCCLIIQHHRSLNDPPNPTPHHAWVALCWCHRAGD